MATSELARLGVYLEELEAVRAMFADTTAMRVDGVSPLRRPTSVNFHEVDVPPFLDALDLAISRTRKTMRRLLADDGDES